MGEIIHTDRNASIERKISLQISLSWREVYQAFWAMDSEEMALFFNELGCQPNLIFQLQHVTDSDTLNSNGRNAMCTIGNYAERIPR